MFITSTAPAASGAGLLTGFSLIVAIGAQNAFVLRQGISRCMVGTVVVICACSDMLLIVAGVAGVGVLIHDHPAALTACRLLGAGYLAWFGMNSLRRARHAERMTTSASTRPRSVVGTCLALTFLNPHVYLDTVLMLGNVANTHGAQGRWWFAGGAVIASWAWFALLGYGARALAGPLGRPRTWRAIDALIGLTMLALAVRLVLG